MNQHSVALGWTLLHFVWQAAVIAAFYGAVEPLLKNANGRYLLGIMAQLGMAFGAVFTFVYEEGLGSSSQPGEAVHLSSVSFMQSWHLAIPGSLVIARVLPWLDALWMFGVIILSIRALGGWWFLNRLGGSVPLLIPEETKQRFLGIARRLRVQRNVGLRLLPGMFSPFTVGLFRSFVYLPLSITTLLSPEQLDAALAHELAHIRRADYLWNLVQTAVETLFFFHPAVWWLGKKVREQRELCCDEIAVCFTAQAWTYAAALLALEEQHNAAVHLRMALNGNEGESGLLARIAHILGRSEATSTRPKVALCLLLALGVCTILVPVSAEHGVVALHALTARGIGNAPTPVLSSRPRAVTTLQNKSRSTGQSGFQKGSLNSHARLNRRQAMGDAETLVVFATPAQGSVKPMLSIPPLPNWEPKAAAIAPLPDFQPRLSAPPMPDLPPYPSTSQ